MRIIIQTNCIVNFIVNSINFNDVCIEIVYSIMTDGHRTVPTDRNLIGTHDFLNIQDYCT